MPTDKRLTGGSASSASSGGARAVAQRVGSSTWTWSISESSAAPIIDTR